jgi:predicted anti-sigma-YlaC factor YlaD
MSISCNVISDLIPLVKDKVASEESSRLVLEHIMSCEKCRLEFEGCDVPATTGVDDRKVVSSIKKRLLFGASSLFLIGGIIGMTVNNNTTPNMTAALIAVMSIAIVGLMLFRLDYKGDGRMSRFFVRKAIGTIFVFILLCFYLLLKYVLQLF